MIVALAALAAVRAAVCALLLGATLDPDTELYAQGGVGLFPSPLGRVIGMGGIPAIALANAATNFVLVLGVARLAALHGGRPRLAALLVVVAPLGLWSIFAGMDTIAAALIVWSLVTARRTRALCELAAVLAHPAALLVVVLARLRPSRASLLSASAACALGAIVCLATPYRAALLDLDPLVVVTSAIATAAVFAATFLLAWKLRPAIPAIAGGSLASGLMAGAAWETNLRYLLPAVGVAAASVTRRSA